MKPEQIAELEALAEKATPGPWRAFCGATHTRVYSDADGTVQVAEIAGPSDVGIRPWNGERWEADASLISVLVNNLPAILAALKAQQPDAQAEPVAWMYSHPEGYIDVSKNNMRESYDRWIETPLYAHPPKAQQPGEDDLMDLVSNAYATGATDVHNSWVDGTNGSEPDFGEAASDYARAAIAAMQESRDAED